jgi:hypothetical protein
MSASEQTPVPDVVREFGECVRDEKWTGLALTFTISGGTPSQRKHEAFRLEGTGLLNGRSSDARSSPETREAAVTLAEADAHQLLKRAASGLSRLARQPKVRFPPDAVVGSITVDVDGREATLYFVPEEQRHQQTRRLPGELREGLDVLRAAFRQAINEGGSR